MFVTLFFAYFYLRDSSWRGDISLHTLMETVSTVLALAVGSLALVRFYSKKDNTFLFVGTGFVATAFLDGYHTVVSSSHFIETFPSAPPSLIAWSWFASRIFLSLLLWMSWLFWRREDRLGAAGQISEKLIYSTVTALALVCFAVVAFVPMPVAYYQQLPFPRPQEFLPALFFLLALIGYLRKGKWKTDMFEHWLVLSLIVGFMGQAMFMSFSGQVFDMMFDAAHLLKNGSYICAMLGLLFSMQRLFSESHAQQELQFKNTILATQQEVAPDAILVVDERGKIISYNRNFVELWRLTQEMVEARADEPVLHAVVEQLRDPETFLARIDYLYQHRSEDSHEEIDLRDGRVIDRYSAPMIGEHGKYYGRVWFFRDITERNQTELALRTNEYFLDTLLNAIPVPVFYKDVDGRYLGFNKAYETFFGATKDQLIGKSVFDISPPELANIYHAKDAELYEGRGIQRYESRVKDAQGSFHDVIFNKAVFQDNQGVVSGLIGAILDITERKLAEVEVQKLQEQLRELALHDPLTGLYNRRYLEESMAREITRAERYGQPVGVVMCDLDHFKLVNDTYGHLAGDEVLRVFADLLRTNSRGSDIICRFGGEEFLLLLPDMPPDIAYQRAEELRASLAAQQIGKFAIRMTASFGVAAFPMDGKTQDALISAVDAAMYQAKETGRNRVVVASAHEEDVPDRTDMGSAEVSIQKDKRRTDGH